MARTRNLPGLPDQYPEIERLSTGFLDGTRPSWLTESTTNGTFTYTAENGGRAELATGTTSAGDETRLSAPSWTWDGAGSHVIDMVVAYSHAHAGGGTLQSVVPMVTFDGNNSINHALHNAAMQVKVAGTTTSAAMHSPDFTERHHVRIIMDWVNDEALGFVDGIPTVRVSGLPSRSGADPAFAWIRTQDTTADRVMYIYQWSIRACDVL